MRLKTVWLIVTLALCIFTAALASAVQQPAKVPRIGFLWSGSPGFSLNIEGFQRGLRELGYVEGQNIVVEYRYAEGKAERFPELAAELVRMQVDVIVATGSTAVGATQQATSTIPIVMTGVADPVRSGFVASFARPGGNITGTTSLAVDLSGKRLELLKETVPNLTRVSVLWNARSSAMARRVKEAEAAARGLGVALQSVGVQDPNALETAFAAMTQERPDALLVVLDPFIFVQRKQIVDFAAKNRLPAMYEVREFVDEGGLMSYGPKFTEWIGRAAYYVDRILKGARPGDLPVETPMRFELVINLKTAKELGLTVPPHILFQADAVIQ